MKNNKRDCIVLTPPPKNKIAHQEWANWELIWYNEIGRKNFQKLLIPRGFKKILKNCIRNPNIRFVLMNIGLEVRHNKEFIKGHENFIIIDKKLKIAEHFEPHGYILSEPNYNLPELYQTLTMFFDDFGYEFLQPNETCPLFSFQHIEEQYKSTVKDVGGYCAVWSYFYADIRMANPDIPPLVLSTMILKELKYKPKTFRKFIRNYSQFLLQEIHKLSKQPNIRKYIINQLIKYAE